MEAIGRIALSNEFVPSVRAGPCREIEAGDAHVRVCVSVYVFVCKSAPIIWYGMVWYGMVVVLVRAT